uniref:WD repeat-containing protein 76-like isoform X1 n=2 Tax=Oncorhynchus gorbuscha TaxID=8017 RepID=UPI001EAF48CC|nr:WD repeat-containing protein 76-like isoform X1 [Oncorhynchus gorbuscha]
MVSEEPNLPNTFVKLYYMLQEMKPANTESGVPVLHSAKEVCKPKKFTPDEVLVPNPSFKENQGMKRKRKALPLKVEGRIEKVKEEKEDKDIQPGSLSIYELERLENIRQNQVFLSSLKLLEAKQDLKPEKTQRGLKRQNNKAAWTEVLPPRTKSLRIQKKVAERLPLPPEPHRIYYEVERIERARKPEGPISMEPINMEEDSSLPPELLKLWTEDLIKEEKEELGLGEYRSTLKSMELSEIGGVAKVVKSHIFSVAFHPCSSRLLMAAGDKLGGVGLWNLDSDMGDEGVLLFEPHVQPVACMAFSRSHPTDLLTLSYDGTLRSTDVEKAVFDEVYRIKDGLRTFDFLSHDCSTLVTGDWYGDVAIVDRRTPGTSHESLHSLDTKTVRCVHVHPVQKQYIMVAENSIVSIYDARCLKASSREPVSQLYGHSKSISSAYFSPGTGNRVVTTCLDNNIRIYDTSELTSRAPLLTSIQQNLYTGRWLSKLQAMWDPKRDDCFVVGSMQQPHRVQVFHESGQLQHSFQDPEMTTVLSVTAFHPTRNALLGGNASGRLYVFTD